MGHFAAIPRQSGASEISPEGPFVARLPVAVFRMRSKQAVWVLGTLLAWKCLAGVAPRYGDDSRGHPLDNLMETTMQWTTPSYTDMRFGFEITMYIATR